MPSLVLKLASALGMLLVGVLPVAAVVRRRPSARRSVGLGALAWIVGVLAKFAFALATSKAIKQGLEGAFGASGTIVFCAYVGLLTGVFECLSIFAFLRYSARSRDDDGLAFGLGFAGIEAVLLSLACVAGGAVPPEVPAWVSRLAPVVERIGTAPIHVLSVVLIARGIRLRRPWKGVLASATYKSLVDGVAAWAILVWSVTSSSTKWLRLETAVLAVGLASAITCVRLFRESAVVWRAS
jgi:hypothetical protein